MVSVHMVKLEMVYLGMSYYGPGACTCLKSVTHITGNLYKESNGSPYHHMGSIITIKFKHKLDREMDIQPTRLSKSNLIDCTTFSFDLYYFEAETFYHCFIWCYYQRESEELGPPPSSSSWLHHADRWLVHIQSCFPSHVHVYMNPNEGVDTLDCKINKFNKEDTWLDCCK